LVKELTTVWGEQYRAATQKEEMLLRLMRASRPEIRIVAAKSDLRGLESSKPIPTAVAERLRVLVGTATRGCASAPRTRCRE